MDKYVRICPNCGHEIEYKSYSAWHSANKKSSECRSCAYRKSATRVADLSVLLEDTYESYYWMGFLLADGSFSDSRLKLTLKKSDKEQVHRFGEYIKYTGSYGVSNTSESVSCKDSLIVPKIMNKFNILPAKTYNPPTGLEFINEDLLLCLIAGFIDGDGNIQRHSKRDDFFLRIKLHSSWIGVLNTFSMVICKGSKAKINSSGYAELVISNTKILQALKERVATYNLPLLKRKWNIIDIRFVSKYTTAEDLRNRVIELLNKGTRNKDIASICNTSPANVTRIKKAYETRNKI